MGYRIGADIGGTFTDIVLVADGRDAAAASLEIGKVLTTPEAPERAVLEGIEMVLARAGRDAAEVSAVIHGTTLFTNAMIERKGARTALVTTKGFRDAIEIAREHRYDMYDLFIERPEPLAPRDLRFEVDERVLADGSIHRPLDEASVAPVIEALRAADIEAVAVCLLHAYANDSHEHQVGAMIAAALPDIAMSLSADIVREIREFDRASTTLANVYVKRLAETYLGRLDSGLRD
ncbi:MAG: hydantoinase/oxoprolinase N-terminal domain-containing protein, partial [Pseudomonadota bacterium]